MSALAIASAGLLAAAAHLRSRSRPARGVGSRSAARNLGTISSAKLKGQLQAGDDDDDIVLVWAIDGSEVTYTLADLKEHKTWLDEDEPSPEEVFAYVWPLVQHADAFLNQIEFPVRLYRGLFAKSLGAIRPSLGLHWTTDPAVARRFAIGEHEGSSGSMRATDKPFAISMVLDDPSKIDWASTIDNFFRYTAAEGDDPSIVERQIVLRPHKDTKEIGRGIRVRQLPS
jgi:hypothetical protein